MNNENEKKLEVIADKLEARLKEECPLLSLRDDFYEIVDYNAKEIIKHEIPIEEAVDNIILISECSKEVVKRKR